MTNGTVHMRGESGPGVPVEVQAGGKRLRLVSGSEAVGDWDITSIGIQPLNDGFAIRAEGEEFILKTEDDSGIAREIGMGAALPSVASRSPVTHIPPPSAPVPQADQANPLLAAIVFAFGGVLVLSGGFFLREDPTLGVAGRTTTEGLQLGGRFWFAFVLGGLLMVGVGFALASGVRWARFTAVVSLVGLVLLFGVVAQNAAPGAGFLLAYGFIAGGIVVGVAVLFAGSLGEAD